jgi:hypothetical protein
MIEKFSVSAIQGMPDKDPLLLLLHHLPPMYPLSSILLWPQGQVCHHWVLKQNNDY